MTHADVTIVAVVNFTPVPRARLSHRRAARRRRIAELLNSDAEVYGGSNIGNQGACAAEAKTVARLRAIR